MIVMHIYQTAITKIKKLFKNHETYSHYFLYYRLLLSQR